MCLVSAMTKSSFNPLITTAPLNSKYIHFYILFIQITSISLFRLKCMKSSLQNPRWLKNYWANLHSDTCTISLQLPWNRPTLVMVCSAVMSWIQKVLKTKKAKLNSWLNWSCLLKWLFKRKSMSSQVWFLQVNRLTRLTFGFNRCIEQLLLVLIPDHMLLKFSVTMRVRNKNNNKMPLMVLMVLMTRILELSKRHNNKRLCANNKKLRELRKKEKRRKKREGNNKKRKRREWEKNRLELSKSNLWDNKWNKRNKWWLNNSKKKCKDSRKWWWNNRETSNLSEMVKKNNLKKMIAEWWCKLKAWEINNLKVVVVL